MVKFPNAYSDSYGSSHMGNHEIFQWVALRGLSSRVNSGGQVGSKGKVVPVHTIKASTEGVEIQFHLALDAGESSAYPPGKEPLVPTK
jgi:hypothetical protein